MELTHKEIPLRFLQSIPEGIKYVRKHGKDYLVVEKIFCPKGHNLISDTVRIHDEPSVKLILKVGDSEGAVFVDAYWGGHAKLYGFVPDIKTKGSIVSAFCSTCHESLIVDAPCTDEKCESKKAIMFILPGGENKIYVCAKLGCPGHRIEIENVPDAVAREVSCINYFGAQMDDILMEI